MWQLFTGYEYFSMNLNIIGSPHEGGRPHREIHLPTKYKYSHLLERKRHWREKDLNHIADYTCGDGEVGNSINPFYLHVIYV